MSNSKLCWPTPNGRPGLVPTVVLLGCILLLAISAPAVELDLGRIVTAIPRMLAFAGNMLVLPDWEYLPILAKNILQTIEMTFLATTGNQSAIGRSGGEKYQSTSRCFSCYPQFVVLDARAARAGLGVGVCVCGRLRTFAGNHGAVICDGRFYG